MKKTERRTRPETSRKSPRSATLNSGEPTSQNLAEIKALIELVAEKQITEFELERGDFRLRIQRGSTAAAAAPVILQPAPTQASAPVVVEAPRQVEAAAPPHFLQPPSVSPVEESLHIITSPIVGTFYRLPSPTADPFVKIGDNIEKGRTLCIIEAMKLMNEITAEVSGTVVKIFVENGQPVEYGQPLFGIRL
jgi:acetyl-CoA carboxylase biotin carboxyl carrier protein